MTNALCEEIGLELQAFVRGDSSQEAAPRVDVLRIEEHLRDCAFCTGELREIEIVENLLREHLAEIEPSPAFASTFANRLAADVLDEEKQAESRGWFGSPTPTWPIPAWLVTFGVAALAAVALFGGRPGSVPHEVAVVPKGITPAPVVIAVAGDDAILGSPPPDLIERADFFVDYAVIESLDSLDLTASAG